PDRPPPPTVSPSDPATNTPYPDDSRLAPRRSPSEASPSSSRSFSPPPSRPSSLLFSCPPSGRHALSRLPWRHGDVVRREGEPRETAREPGTREASQPGGATAGKGGEADRQTAAGG